MYKYIYVEAQNEGVFRKSNYKEIIDKHAEDGWRFVTSIPKEFSGYGIIKKFDLVFEKVID